MPPKSLPVDDATFDAVLVVFGVALVRTTDGDERDGAGPARRRLALRPVERVQSRRALAARRSSRCANVPKTKASVRGVGPPTSGIDSEFDVEAQVELDWTWTRSVDEVVALFGTYSGAIIRTDEERVEMVERSASSDSRRWPWTASW